MADIEPLLTIADIQRIYGVKKSAAHEIVASPRFPRPVTEGVRCRRWLPDDIRAHWAGLTKGTQRRAG